MSTVNIIGLCMYPACIVGWVLYLRHLKSRRTTVQQLVALQLTGLAVMIGFLLLSSYLVRL